MVVEKVVKEKPKEFGSKHESRFLMQIELILCISKGLRIFRSVQNHEDISES